MRAKFYSRQLAVQRELLAVGDHLHTRHYRNACIIANILAYEELSRQTIVDSWEAIGQKPGEHVSLDTAMEQPRFNKSCTGAWMVCLWCVRV